jgi:hypothetical protein
MRLVRIDLRREIHVVAQIVDHFAHAVDLGLVGTLRLTEHRRRADRVPITACEQFRRSQHDRGALDPGKRCPCLVSGERRVDRHLHFGLAGLMTSREHVSVFARHDDVSGPPRTDFPAADDERNIDDRVGHPIQFPFQRRSAHRSGREVADRFVSGFRKAEYAVVHGCLLRLLEDSAFRGPEASVLTRARGGTSCVDWVAHSLYNAWRKVVPLARLERAAYGLGKQFRHTNRCHYNCL